ncbi:MAG: metalloregulator ArsR/SmtB family transcription factor [Eubacteriales bacterium]|nr:metalloregulator ArsR/SmtB family transcription factor [Eubacteriales bacterium]
MNCFKTGIPILKALCDETRLGILSMLSQREMNACEINRSFDCTQPTISYHMRLLVDTGLVRARREGCQVFYTVNECIWPSVEALLNTLCHCCCKGEKE